MSSGWSTVARLLHTVRYLRSEQILYRLLLPIRPRRVRRVRDAIARPWPRPWPDCPLAETSLVAPAIFRFLGEEGCVAAASDWNDPRRSRLWLYNLHYFDDLNAVGADERVDSHRALLRRWVDQNPPGRGTGWEPYPLSLRIVNLVKWLSRHGAHEPFLLDSLATQAGALSRRIEYHLLGNHILANAKALAFAGAFFQGHCADAWLALGSRILDREVPEQFLADGGHFERSPMYQSTLAADLLDLLQLADITQLDPLRERRERWADVVARALRWLRVMTHPDGEIAFFNDAALGAAPHPARLAAVAARFLPAPAAGGGPLFDLVILRESGYLRVDLPAEGAAIIDVAPLGPDYLPAHGHADALSFELSLFGARVLVNSGTSVYGEGPERLRQRGTAAHNTVVVDGADSSEVWSGFRVARRARARLHEAAIRSGSIVVHASHDGYRRLPGRNMHSRRWTFGPDSMSVQDSVSGRFARAQARWHLHPEVAVHEFDAALRRATLRTAGGCLVRVEVSGARLGVERATWHPRFGASVATSCLTCEFEGDQVTTQIFWRQDT